MRALLHDISAGACLFILCFLLVGCQDGAWQVHATAGQISHDTAQVGRAVILGERRRALVAAAQGAEDIGAAVRARAATWDAEYGELIGAYNIFAAACNTYAQSAFAAIRGEAGSLNELRLLAANVAAAWDAVADLLEDAADLSLPRIPDWLLGFLRGQATPTAGGAS